MPFVDIKLLAGRDRDRKNALIRNVTLAVAESLGIDNEHVTVVLTEVDRADWARGGVTFAEKPPAS